MDASRHSCQESDYALYLDLLADAAEKARAEVWSYCLMPNHVHIILTPSDSEGLSRTFGKLHRGYTGFINARRRTTGHLWQGRFGSVALDDPHFATALRYVALNPSRLRFRAALEANGSQLCILPPELLNYVYFPRNCGRNSVLQKGALPSSKQMLHQIRAAESG